jgi:large conductance mechanosensitive channel
MKKLFSEFKQFAIQGDAIDLAVGVIIGAGFKTIVDSIVKDLFTPIISLITTMLMQRQNFRFNTELAWTKVNTSISDFLSSVVNFLIVAVCIFFIVRVINKLHKKEAKPKEPAPTNSELLLAEIRDLLIQQKKDEK